MPTDYFLKFSKKLANMEIISTAKILWRWKYEIATIYENGVSSYFHANRIFIDYNSREKKNQMKTTFSDSHGHF